MRNVVIQSLGKVVLIVLFVYTLGEMHIGFLAMDEFDRLLAEGKFQEAIQIQVVPPWTAIILTVAFGIAFQITNYFFFKRPLNKLEEFEEKDEREVIVTNKAVRAAYSSIMISAFLGIGLIALKTDWLYVNPALPIYTIGMIVIVAIVVYSTAWCIEIRK